MAQFTLPINSIVKKGKTFESKLLPKNQLSDDLGQMIMIKKINDNLSKAIKITKNNQNFSREFLFDVFSNYELFKEREGFVF